MSNKNVNNIVKISNALINYQHAGNLNDLTASESQLELNRIALATMKQKDISIPFVSKECIYSNPLALFESFYGKLDMEVVEKLVNDVHAEIKKNKVLKYDYALALTDMEVEAMKVLTALTTAIDIQIDSYVSSLALIHIFYENVRKLMRNTAHEAGLTLTKDEVNILTFTYLNGLHHNFTELLTARATLLRKFQQEFPNLLANADERMEYAIENDENEETEDTSQGECANNNPDIQVGCIEIDLKSGTVKSNAGAKLPPELIEALQLAAKHLGK